MGLMEDDSVICGEHHITKSDKKIKHVFYKEKPVINNKLLEEIESADLIVFSMGSLYTSLLPCLICEEIKDKIDKCKAPIVYVCNLFTQPGETDKFNVSDHLNVINRYLGTKKVSVVVANNGKIDRKLARKYLTKEQKDPVVLDYEKVVEMVDNIIDDNLVKIENNVFRHNYLKLGFLIFSILLNHKSPKKEIIK